MDEEGKKILHYHDWNVVNVAAILGTTKLYVEWNTGEQAVLDFKP